MKRLLRILVFAFLFVACSGGNNTPLTISEAWVRQSPMMERAGAAYLTVENNTGTEDRLLSVTTTVANNVELHETKEVDGMMQMSPMPDGIPVPANGRLELKPGGYHIMLLALQEELAIDQEVTLTLHFQNAGDVAVTAVVRDE